MDDTTSYDEQLIGVLDACDRGDVKRLGEFIIAGGELKDLLDSRGRTALHHCVRRSKQSQPEVKRSLFEQLDRIKCARIIVKTDSSFLSQLDYQGLSAMHLAVRNNDLEFVRAMLEFRPPLDVKTESSESSTSGQSVVTSPNIGGRTVIHLAVLHAHLDMLVSLFELDASDCINSLDEQGASALHYAVQLPTSIAPEVIQMLAECAKADLNVTDTHGRTALSWAATIGANEAVTELLKHGAKLNVPDECGLTALHCAASRGHSDIVHSMLSWISVANLDDPSRMTVFRDVTDKDGCTPLFYSVTMGHHEVTKCLLKYGADVKSQDHKGRTLAHCLARLGTTPIVNREEELKTNEYGNPPNISDLHVQITDLLDAGLNPWVPTNSGAAPLHEACLLRNIPFVNELSKLPTFAQHVDVRDAQGHTALHLVVAASWSSDANGLELCECLIRNGANVNASTLLPQGGAVTPLDLALMNETEEKVKHGQIRALLEKYGAKTFEQLNKTSKSNVSDTTKKSSASGLSKSRKSPTSEKYTEMLHGGNMDKDEYKSRSTMTCNNDFVETSIQPARRKSPKPYSIVDAQSTHQNRVHSQSIYTSRGCQTEFGNFKKCSKSMDSGTKLCTQREIGIQFDSSVSIDASQIKTSSSTCSANSKRSTNSSSISVRLDTPCSSNMEGFSGQYTQQKCKTKQRLPNCSTTPSKLPYSQIYLERELPNILRRYLNDDEHLVSPLTGRSRMPKPTLSPYLIPLVPYSNRIVGSNRKSDTRTMSGSRSPMRKPLATRNSNQHLDRKVRNASPTNRCTREQNRTISTSDSWITHPSNRQIVTQLMQHYLKDPYANPSRTGNKRDRAKVNENQRELNSNRKIGETTKTRSAMGGELSPVGFREEPEKRDMTKPRKGMKFRNEPSPIGRSKSLKDLRAH